MWFQILKCFKLITQVCSEKRRYDCGQIKNIFYLWPANRIKAIVYTFLIDNPFCALRIFFQKNYIDVLYMSEIRNKTFVKNAKIKIIILNDINHTILNLKYASENVSVMFALKLSLFNENKNQILFSSSRKEWN